MTRTITEQSIIGDESAKTSGRVGLLLEDQNGALHLIAPRNVIPPFTSAVLWTDGAPINIGLSNALPRILSHNNSALDFLSIVTMPPHIMVSSSWRGLQSEVASDEGSGLLCLGEELVPVYFGRGGLAIYVVDGAVGEPALLVGCTEVFANKMAPRAKNGDAGAIVITENNVPLGVVVAATDSIIFMVPVGDLISSAIYNPASHESIRRHNDRCAERSAGTSALSHGAEYKTSGAGEVPLGPWHGRSLTSSRRPGQQSALPLCEIQDAFPCLPFKKLEAGRQRQVEQLHDWVASNILAMVDVPRRLSEAHLWPLTIALETPLDHLLHAIARSCTELEPALAEDLFCRLLKTIEAVSIHDCLPFRVKMWEIITMALETTSPWATDKFVASLSRQVTRMMFIDIKEVARVERHAVADAVLGLSDPAARSFLLDELLAWDAGDDPRLAAQVVLNRYIGTGRDLDDACHQYGDLMLSVLGADTTIRQRFLDELGRFEAEEGRLIPSKQLAQHINDQVRSLEIYHPRMGNTPMSTRAAVIRVRWELKQLDALVVG